MTKMELKTLSKLLVFAFLWLLLINVAMANQQRELTLLNWSEYLDPELISEFEQRFNTKLREVYFETDSERDAMLVDADGIGYDLAIIDGSSLSTYRARGWLAPLDEAQMPNLRFVNPRWQREREAAIGYAVPYFWGTLGIAYRADLVPEPITRWQQLLQPTPALQGKIVMIADNRELVTAALLALGHPVNTTDRKALTQAEAVLLAQKPFVKNYDYIALTEESSLVTGDIVATMAYSGDALVIQEYNENIVYVVPEEGSVLWVDYLAVMASSPNKDLAMAFINFLNEPEKAAQLAQYVHYATPNSGAEALLPDEFQADLVIYPPATQLARSQAFADLPPRVMKTYSSIFAQVIR